MITIPISSLVGDFLIKSSVVSGAIGTQILPNDTTRWAVIFSNNGAAIAQVAPGGKAANPNYGLTVPGNGNLAVPWSLYPTLPSQSWFLTNIGATSISVTEIFYRPAGHQLSEASGLQPLPEAFGSQAAPIDMSLDNQ